VAVACGLLAVVALNLQTFGPRLGWLAGDDRADPDALAIPEDLDAVVHGAVRSGTPGAVATGAAATGAAPLRDPFRAPAAPRPAPARRPARAPARAAAEPEPLRCTAVLLGGERPLALIAGATHGPGDAVRGHEILRITADGVRLRSPAGEVVDLRVGAGAEPDTTYHVVTETRGASGAGQTSLAASRTDERTER
jgi:hypothetical protein